MSDVTYKKRYNMRGIMLRAEERTPKNGSDPYFTGEIKTKGGKTYRFVAFGKAARDLPKMPVDEVLQFWVSFQNRIVDKGTGTETRRYVNLRIHAVSRIKSLEEIKVLAAAKQARLLAA